jgi:drug/metabolite transporter (DMT)-like permease
MAPFLFVIGGILSLCGAVWFGLAAFQVRYVEGLIPIISFAHSQTLAAILASTLAIVASVCFATSTILQRLPDPPSLD